MKLDNQSSHPSEIKFQVNEMKLVSYKCLLKRKINALRIGDLKTYLAAKKKMSQIKLVETVK
jgi:hypothetical protein